MKKEKEKELSFWWAGGRFLAQPGAARARGRRPSCGPRRGDGAGARGEDVVAAGPHASESKGGNSATG